MGRRGFLLCLIGWVLWFGAAFPTCANSQPVGLLLVHGYASGPDSWSQSGILDFLEAQGWHFGGLLQAGPGGEVQRRLTADHQDRLYYLVDLPSEAPLSAQADILQVMLSPFSRQQPHRLLFAAGHSAGGLALRLAMVRYPKLGIQGLITIATPNRGTDTAKLAHFLAQSPMAMVTPMLGLGTLNRSQNLYAELEPEQPGNFLFWLNHAPHPQAHYLAIIRESGGLTGIDPIVSAESQDLTRVTALRGRAERMVSGTGHALETRDAQHMLGIVARWLADGHE
ncbi:MAG: hypothetical protein HQL74_10525 [Magnetococcales bacterium]|nr:hypothetical protein [Magnetococcales bacterium]